MYLLSLESFSAMKISLESQAACPRYGSSAENLCGNFTLILCAPILYVFFMFLAPLSLLFLYSNSQGLCAKFLWAVFCALCFVFCVLIEIIGKKIVILAEGIFSEQGLKNTTFGQGPKSYMCQAVDCGLCAVFCALWAVRSSKWAWQSKCH